MKKLFMTMLLAVAMVMPMNIKADTKIKPVTVKKENVVAGEIIEVEFPYEIDVKDLNLTGLTYLGYEEPVHTFRADVDMVEVTIHLHAELVSGADREDHEDGEGNHIGTPGEGSGETVDWTGFALGKHGWTMQDGRIMYAIRLDVNKYTRYEHIFVQDIHTNLGGLELGGVRVIVPNDEGKAETIRETPSELVQDEEGEFTLKIEVPSMDEHEEMRLDIVYYMSKSGQEDPTNKYKVYTLEEWEKVISEGVGSGEVSETPPEEDKEEEIPMTPLEPATPVEEDKPEDKEEEKEVEKEETPDKETGEKPNKPSEPITDDSDDVKEEEVETPKEEVKEPTQAPKEPTEKEEASSVSTEPVKEDVLPPTGVSTHLTAVATLMVALGTIILATKDKK